MVPHTIRCLTRYPHFENQCLIIQIKSARIRISELSVIQESVLRDEIVVTETENKILVIRVLGVDRHDGDGLPFLVLL